MAAIFELSNGTIMANISNLGCTIVSLLIPDALGNMADVVLGFDSVEQYMQDHASYFGCIVGRVANRIKDGKFTLNGMKYTLPINKPPNSLHGGNNGFNKRLWEVIEHNTGNHPSITFKLHSKDGEEGYPGDVTITATYSLPSTRTMKLYMEAVPENQATPISLSQHTYWNLAGHNAGDILDHSAQIWADHITPVDETLIPTGETMPVIGTPYDFTTEHAIGSRIHEIDGGYDHNYVLDLGEEEEESGLKRAIRLRDPKSKRVLDLWTDAPGLQFYTGNEIDGIKGKGGRVYGKHSGVCLETQAFPDAINHPNFPSVVIQPGEKYMHTMVYEFSDE